MRPTSENTSPLLPQTNSEVGIQAQKAKKTVEEDRKETEEILKQKGLISTEYDDNKNNGGASEAV
jgi:hypothetical protein